VQLGVNARMASGMALTEAMAAGFARLTLGHIGRTYPHKLDHIMTGPDDVAPPDVLHPIFHGSFDWHSCVHGWWQLPRIARRFPDLPEGAAIRELADTMLVPEKVAVELAYFERSGAAGFERPSGWAWLLALHDEASRHEAGWAAALEPLARLIADEFASYIQKLTYPIRTGTHFNTAFACLLASRWAPGRDPMFGALILERARDWFDSDRDAQAWEPGGDEFLSPTLVEAAFMIELFDIVSATKWFEAFLPRLAAGAPATLFTPAAVSDRSDGKIAHLDGLNLSRAWCWRTLARELGPDHPVAPLARDAAERHLAASLPHLADDCMGAHWLATFALLALEA